jgi:hypothetical protein
MKVRITKRTVDALRSGESIADVEIRGFVARRLTSGTVTYGYRFRNRAAQQRWLPLGLHGQITPDQARDLAKKRAGEVADNRDPVAERVATRDATTNTVNSVLDRLLVMCASKIFGAPMKSSAPLRSMYEAVSATDRSTTCAGAISSTCST